MTEGQFCEHKTVSLRIKCYVQRQLSQGWFSFHRTPIILCGLHSGFMSLSLRGYCGLWSPHMTIFSSLVVLLFLVLGRSLQLTVGLIQLCLQLPFPISCSLPQLVFSVFSINSVLVSSGYCNKLSTNLVAIHVKITQIYCLIILEVRSLKWVSWGKIKVIIGLYSFMDVLGDNLFLIHSNSRNHRHS